MEFDGLCGRCGVVVDLDFVGGSGGRGFLLEKEQRVANADFVAGFELALFDGNAVDERSGMAIQIVEDIAALLIGDGAVLGRNPRIFQVDGIVGVAPEKDLADEGIDAFAIRAVDGDKSSSHTSTRRMEPSKGGDSSARTRRAPQVYPNGERPIQTARAPA